MNLDKKALEGPEVKAAFAQVRKIADWMDPNVGAQPYATNLKRFVDGDMGMMIMGGWAQGVLAQRRFQVRRLHHRARPQRQWQGRSSC
jgi:glucose/mannose transport system substrate-binding protein